MLRPEGSRLCWHGAGNSWDCDENEHVNVRFYTRCFEQAAAYPCLEVGAPLEAGRPTEIVIRYHSELRAAETVSVWAAPLAAESGMGPNNAVFYLVND